LAAVFIRRRFGIVVTEVLPADSDRRIALVDLLDRVLAGGVVISGDVVLSIADVDMVVISLRTLISSVGALLPVELDVGGDR
jgi:Gas vesicle protein